MCDHCVKRDRAYAALSDEDRQAVEAVQTSANHRLNTLAMAGIGSEEFENAYIEAGEVLDIALGIIVSSPVPDSLPPDWR